MASISIPLNTWLPAPCSEAICLDTHHEKDQQNFHFGLYVKVQSAVASALEIQVRYFYSRQENWLVAAKDAKRPGNTDVLQIHKLYANGHIKYKEGKLTEEKIRSAVNGWILQVREVSDFRKTSRQISDPTIIALFQRGKQEAFLKAIEELLPNLNESQRDIDPSEFNGPIMYMLM